MITEALLLTAEDFEPYKGMFNSDDFTTVERYLREAQELDLRPALGPALYYDLIKNRSEQRNIDLLDGKEYDYNGDTIFFEGLRPVLVYFAHARYIRSANVQSTSAGLVVKQTPESTPASEKTIAGMIAQSNSAAVSYLNEAVRFLNENRADYTLWKSSVNARSKRGIKISAIGGNSTDGYTHGNGCCCENCSRDEI